MLDLAVTIGITLGAIVVLWLIARWATQGQFGFTQLIMGADGRLSTSKFQAAVWTVVTLASYIAVYVANVLKGTFNPVISIPGPLVILAGFSVGSFVAASAVTASRSQFKNRAPPEEGPRTPRDLVNNDDNKTDLGKFQLVAWTLVAVVVFLLGLVENLDAFFSLAAGATPPPSLFPQIDQTLLTFSGISQATYLTNKALTPDATTLPEAKVSSPQSNGSSRPPARPAGVGENR